MKRQIVFSANGIRFGNPKHGYICLVKKDENYEKNIASLKSIYGKIRARGRHSDRKAVLGAGYRPGSQNEIPVKDAEYVAVYHRS